MEDNVVSIRFLPYFRGKPATCLICGSREVIPIVYGLPDEEMISLAKKGVITLGGDVIIGRVPAWRCNGCGEEFGDREARDKGPTEPWVDKLLQEGWSQKASPKPDRCPHCGSQNLIPILYALPDRDMIDAAMRGDIELGGDVVVLGHDPAWHCKDCRKNCGVMLG